MDTKEKDKTQVEPIKRSQVVTNVSPLICFFPSHDGRTLNGTTNTIVKIADILKRPLMTFSSSGMGQAVSLNGMVEGFKNAFSNERGERIKLSGIFRALWIEDDIYLDIGEAPKIAQMITTADENNWNMTAPYTTGLDDDKIECPTCGRSGHENWVYFHFPNPKTKEIGRPFTLKEIQDLYPYDEIHGLAGLGFYYGDINVDYVWHEGDYNGQDRFGMPSYAGIDWNYYLDNNIELRHFPIRISHDKSKWWQNDKALKNVGPRPTVEVRTVGPTGKIE